MGTPIQKEFGPGYDSPPRKFHFWAVILPTVVLIALAVALMRDTGSTSSKLTRSPIVTCPKQMCPAPGATQSAQPAKKTSTSAAGLSAAETTASDSSSPTLKAAVGRASSRPSSPSPSSNLSPVQTSPSPGSPSSPSASPVLSVTRALLRQASSAVTHAVLLSSA
jgi:hypothetical protein